MYCRYRTDEWIDRLFENWKIAASTFSGLQNFSRRTLHSPPGGLSDVEPSLHL